jgi:biotin synthase
MIRSQWRAGPSRHARHVKNVLDSDRDAMQRTPVMARSRLMAQYFGIATSARLVHLDPGVQPPLVGVDLRKTPLDQVARMNLGAPDPRSNVRNRHPFGHRSPFCGYRDFGIMARMNRIHEIERMSTLPEAEPNTGRGGANDWRSLAERVLDGHRLTPDEGLAILQSSDEEILDLLAAAYRVRRRWFGNRVDLNFLINAKSGQCGEDCGYCSQSRISKAEIPRYRLMTAEQVRDGARIAAERQAKTYCTVISGRSPTDAELDTLAQVVPEVKAAYGLQICFSVGLLSVEQAARLKQCGVDRVNHNLNTSRRFYPQICTTHTYDDRLATLRAVRQAGLQICSGGVVGMGEEDSDVVDLALELGKLQAEAVPVNFLEPIAGTPLENRRGLNPRYCLKVLALFRLANPRCELRIAAGREMHLGPLQPLGLYAANSIFVGDYLTTKGQPPKEDYQMIEAMGFEVGVR